MKVGSFVVLGLLLFGKNQLPTSYGFVDLYLEVSNVIEKILTAVKNTKAIKSLFGLDRQHNIYYILVKFVTFFIRTVWFV
jgi:hypothetical protein